MLCLCVPLRSPLRGFGGGAENLQPLFWRMGPGSPDLHLFPLSRTGNFGEKTAGLDMVSGDSSSAGKQSEPSKGPVVTGHCVEGEEKCSNSKLFLATVRE